jgi:hypothetical protein
MEISCVYKVFRPSAKTGASLRIYATYRPSCNQAARRAREIYAQACKEVEAVEVAALDPSLELVYRVGGAERAAS